MDNRGPTVFHISWAYPSFWPQKTADNRGLTVYCVMYNVCVFGVAVLIVESVPSYNYIESRTVCHKKCMKACHLDDARM